MLSQDPIADLVAHHALESLGEDLVAEFFGQFLRDLGAQGVLTSLESHLVRVFL